MNLIPNKYIYTFTHETYESDLCQLESKYIFNSEQNNKILFTDVKVSPSNSAFIKNRLAIISCSENFESLLLEIKKEGIQVEGFKVEYLVFDGDSTPYAVRLKKLRDIGYSIEGMHEYYNPTFTYGLCNVEGVWCFGELVKNNLEWNKHKQKPHSFSNSIGINIGKALVNIASNSNKEAKLLDACCGMGTIMLEACFAGFSIEGCDINRKTANNAINNLAHFNYTANVYNSDIKEIKGRYDAAIIDLPYNLFTKIMDGEIEHIVESTAEITNRMVIVSTSDITDLIHYLDFKIVDYCTVGKRGKTQFARKIWVCERV